MSHRSGIVCGFRIQGRNSLQLRYKRVHLLVVKLKIIAAGFPAVRGFHSKEYRVSGQQAHLLGILYEKILMQHYMVQLYGLCRIVSVPVARRDNKNIIFSYFIAAVVEVMVALPPDYEIQFIKIVNMHPRFVILLIKGSGKNGGGWIEKIVAVPMYNVRIWQGFWRHS